MEDLSSIIENKKRRIRLNSMPIFTAVGRELHKDEDKDKDDKELEIVMSNDENKKRYRKERKESDTSDIKSDGDVNSPDSKKVRKDQSEVMATMDIVNEELAVVYATEAISKLSIETNDNDIKKLVDCYNPIIDMEMMKKHMLEASENWRDKERKYKSAIKFVVNDEKEIEETDIGELAEILLGAIANRTAKYCNDCRNWYMIGRENKPKIFCTWCKVGMHDCKNVDEIEKINGLKWFCNECNELFTLRLQPQMKEIMNDNIFKGFKEGDVQGKNSIREIHKKIEEIRKGTDTVEEEVIDLAKDDEINQGIVEEKKDQEKEKEKKNEDKKDDTNDKETKKKECWFWLNRKCKYGDRCKYEHPTLCKQMMEIGKCYDHRCKIPHPNTCNSLFFEGYCSREQNCWYIHPSNIVNKYQNREHNDNNNQIRNENNNNNQYNNRNCNQDNNNNNYNQNNIVNDRYNCSNQQTFLEQWPTPWETRSQMKMMMGNMIEQMTKFMSMSR